MTCFYIVVNGGCAGVEAREGGPSCMRGHEQLVDSDDDLSDPSFKAGRKRKGANEFSCCLCYIHLSNPEGVVSSTGHVKMM